MWKRIQEVVFALLLILASIQPVAAENSVELETKLAFAGIVKRSAWTEVQVKVTNTGEPLQGELRLIGSLERGPEQKNELNQIVSLGKGESKTFMFEVPGEWLTESKCTIQLIREKMVLETATLLPVSTQERKNIAVVDDHPNALYFLGAIGSTAATNAQHSKSEAFATSADESNVIMKHVTTADLPSKSWLYNNVNILALGNLDESALKSEQITALKEWIRTGGVLLLSTGPGKESLMKHFSDIYPVTLGNSGNENNLQILKRLSGNKSLPVTTLPVLDQGKKLLELKKVGAGKIIFANYDLSAEPLASWQYNRQLWSALIEQTGVLTQEDSATEGAMADLSSMIPGVKTPTALTLAVIWFVYMLVVAPGLYFMLKRWDRREWAWVIIPAFSILLTLGVVVIGRQQVAAKDASYAVSTIQIKDKDVARVDTVSSFLSINGGDYSIQTEKGYTSIHKSRNRMHKAETTYVPQKEGTKAELLKNVPYLTLQYATAVGEAPGIGSFDYSLAVKGKQIVGTIANQTSFDLEETYVYVGNQHMPVGPLRKGEEKKVALPFETYYMRPKQEERPFYQGISYEENVKMLKSGIAEIGGNTSIRIVGFSSQRLPVMQMSTPEHNEHYFQVLTQPIRFKNESGSLTVYPYGTQSVEEVQIEGNVSPEDGYLYTFGKGSITFALDIKRLNLDPIEITSPVNEGPYLPIEKEVYDVTTKKWVKIQRDKPIVLTRQNISQYINDQGKMLLRFSNKSEERLSIPLPVFYVEGKERSFDDNYTKPE